MHVLWFEAEAQCPKVWLYNYFLWQNDKRKMQLGELRDYENPLKKQL